MFTELHLTAAVSQPTMDYPGDEDLSRPLILPYGCSLKTDI